MAFDMITPAMAQFAALGLGALLLLALWKRKAIGLPKIPAKFKR